jgi:hypothetical protein
VVPVTRILVLLAIIIALFVFLPPTPAVAWSSVPFLLLGALFFDAYRRGRRLLLAREKDEKRDELVDGSRFVMGMMIFHAVWVGIGAGQGAAADGLHAHGMDVGGGADLAGFDGGFDAGGDAGGGAGGF